jgi:thiol-disulfide isomerase/thioredoxin
MQTHSNPSSRLASPLVRGALAAVLLAAIAGAFLLARSGGDGDARSVDGTALVLPTPVVTARPAVSLGPQDGRAPAKGGPAPDFVLRGLDGHTVQLSDLHGRVVLVNFWATWCRPCRKELPDIQQLAREYPDELVVLTVNVEDNADVARAFMEDRGLALTVLLDEDGAVYHQYRLTGMPNSFFVDRDGALAAFQWGYMTQTMMRDRLADAGLP